MGGGAIGKGRLEDIEKKAGEVLVAVLYSGEITIHTFETNN